MHLRRCVAMGRKSQKMKQGFSILRNSKQVTLFRLFSEKHSCKFWKNTFHLSKRCQNSCKNQSIIWSSRKFTKATRCIYFEFGKKIFFLWELGEVGKRKNDDICYWYSERANRKSVTVVPQQMLDVYISNRSSTFAKKICLVSKQKGQK